MAAATNRLNEKAVLTLGRLLISELGRHRVVQESVFVSTMTGWFVRARPSVVDFSRDSKEETRATL
jgi:hypothetical protein